MYQTRFKISRKKFQALVKWIKDDKIAQRVSCPRNIGMEAGDRSIIDFCSVVCWRLFPQLKVGRGCPCNHQPLTTVLKRVRSLINYNKQFHLTKMETR